MTREKQNLLTANMADRLPVLRKVMGFSQQELADIVGMSRSTITKVEGKRQELPWSTYLALLLIFRENSETNLLLRTFEIDTDEVNIFISGNSGTEG